MLIIDITVVTVALPDIGHDLALSRAATTWVMTAYTLLFGGLMIFGGRAADLFGARRMATTGLALFTAFSLLAGLSVNAPMLIGGRVGQGIGAALLSPAAMAILTRTFHGKERNRALAVWGALGGTGAAVGVLAGGFLTAGPGWSWIFFVNVPIGIVLLTLLPRLVPSIPANPTGTIDRLGAGATTAATAAVIYGLIHAGDNGWTDPVTLGALVAGAGLYAAFLVYETRIADPMLDPRLLLQRPVRAGSIVMLIATGLLITGFFLGSFFLQQAQGHSALVTGLLFVPVALGTIAGAHTAGQVIGHVGFRPVGVAGLLVAAAGAGVPALWHTTPALVAGLTVAAAGQGAALVTATTTALTSVDHAQAGVTSGLVNTFHEIGSALGVATVSTLAAASLRTAGADVGGFGHGFMFAAFAAIATAIAALRLIPAGKPPAGMRIAAH